MKSYKTEQLRNIGLFAHGGAGKTSLAEALLFNTGAINRLGRVEEGTTVSDYDEEEKKRRISVNLSLIPCEWKDCKLNVVDTPGYADFIGEVVEAFRVVDAAVLVLCAVNGVEVGTEQAWRLADERKLPRLAVVSRILEGYRGSIDIQSEAGSGTTCRIWLPERILPAEGNGTIS